MKRICMILFAALALTTAWAHRPAEVTEPLVHDPVMAYEDGMWHLYCTGIGIQHFTSVDRRTWRVDTVPVLRHIPAWTHDSVPGFDRHVWAPDIIKYRGRWWMTYSCSTFGKNTSAIGLASTDRLMGGEWKDEGCVVASKEGRDNWNAIDPNIVLDDEGRPYLAFGSFWDGVQMVPLDTTLHVASVHDPHSLSPRKTGCERAFPATIARRYAPDDTLRMANPTSKYAGTNAIEAPFIIRHGGWYYLFVSWDYCCQGKKSTYRVVCGRSRNITGPYLDRNGKPMLEGGGTPVFAGDKVNYEAAGHCAVYQYGADTYFICHGYSEKLNGTSVLVQRKVKWEKGWPVVNS
ncbi:MAG: family 43 glycosylhydrolase [Prevotella sp.]